MDINFGWKGQAHNIIFKVEGLDKKRGSQSPCTVFFSIDRYIRKKYVYIFKKNDGARPHPHLVATQKRNRGYGFFLWVTTRF